MSAGVSIAAGVSEVFPSATQLGGTLTASGGGTGLSSIAAGFIPVGNGTTILTSVPYGQKLLAYSTSLTFAASGDQVLTMTATTGTYIIRRVTLGPNINALATVIIVGALRTASGGGGSAVTGAFVVTGLTSTTAFLDQAVTLASGVVTNPNLYVNITTAGAASSTYLSVYGDLVVG